MASVPQWWHSIDVGRGVVTPGTKGAGTPGGPHAHMQAELESLALPDLHGKTVLDIGAHNGYYAFAAERLGASRVVALDYFSWIPGPDGSPAPGRSGFDVARRILRSRVEPLLADLTSLDPAALGTFDVVFLLDVLGELADPLAAMRRVAALTSGIAVIASQTMSAGPADGRPLLELVTDVADGERPARHVPNLAAIETLCHAAGFASTQAIAGPARRGAADAGSDTPLRQRAVVHARRR